MTPAPKDATTLERLLNEPRWEEIFQQRVRDNIQFRLTRGYSPYGRELEGSWLLKRQAE